MSIDDNNYTLLGVSPNATSKELRQAYLQLLVTAHPDKGGSAEGFASIQKAYATLSDPAERAIYDEQLDRKNQNRTIKSCTNTSTSSQSVTTNKNGVSAYVHGQTNFPPQRQDHPDRPFGAIFAGQPVNASSTPSVSSISENIRLLKQNRSVRVSSGKNEENHLTPGGLHPKKKSLAELFTQRAALHFAAGRAHHATFDIEEALRIFPEYKEAIDLLEKLKIASLENQNLTTLEVVGDEDE